MTRKNKRHLGQCAYCGVEATTRDHIPPKCLFGSHKPNDLVTVPACQKCNNGASKDDEYAMRLALIDGADKVPSASDVDAAFHRSIERPEAQGLRAGFMKTVSPVTLFTASGLFVENRLGFDLEWDRMATLMNRLIRGFFWKIQKRRLPEGYRTDWHPVTTVPNISPEKARNQRIISTGPYVDWGNGTFRLRAVASPNDGNMTLFRFDFYQTQGFIGYTGRHETNGKFTHLLIEDED